MAGDAKGYEPGSRDAVEAFRERVMNDPMYRALFEHIEAIEAIGGLRLANATLSDVTQDPAAAIKVVGMDLTLKFRADPLSMRRPTTAPIPAPKKRGQTGAGGPQVLPQAAATDGDSGGSGD